jgi:hypothetical protein
MTYAYSYKECLERAERITWRVEDLIGPGKTLDFSRPFLPESLARTDGLDFLSFDEKRTLNHVRGHAYLCIFGLVEEFILPFVLDHARSHINGNDYRARALLEFASEEAKHIQLFHRFTEEFTKGFGTHCAVIGPGETVAKHVLSHHPLSVALTILHIEWMTQRHYVESVRDTKGIDAQFKSLLLHHWMEEMQHAQLDTMMVEVIAEGMSPAEIDQAIDDYFAIGGFLDEGLRQQTAFDLEAFAAATGRRLKPEERARFMEVQHQANRWTYLGSGMSHPKFLETLGQLSASKRQMVKDAAPAFS